MAVVTLLADASRGSVTSPNLTVPNGSPAHIQIAMTSPTFPTDPTLSWNLSVEHSFDGGTNWTPWFGAGSSGGGQGNRGKDGLPLSGLVVTTVQFDGVGKFVRGVISVNTPFVWGLTGEILAT